MWDIKTNKKGCAALGRTGAVTQFSTWPSSCHEGCRLESRQTVTTNRNCCSSHVT